MEKKITYFTTSKGTELPFMDLQGKPYLQVAHRIMWFREENPEWLIEVSFPVMTDKYYIAKAVITDSNGVIRAVGHRIEFKLDDLEKAETGAIGRALGFLGYGTQFATDLFDEGEKLADSPIQPGKKAIVSKHKKENPFIKLAEEKAKEEPPMQDFGDFKDESSLDAIKEARGNAVISTIEYGQLISLASTKKITKNALDQRVLEKWGIENSSKVLRWQFDEMMKAFSGNTK